jgi:hypothetical protein
VISTLHAIDGRFKGEADLARNIGPGRGAPAGARVTPDPADTRPGVHRGTTRVAWLAVFALTLTAFVLRWPRVDYWWSADEAHFWAAAAAPLSEFYEEIRYHTHPPLYFVLMWCWGAVSDSAWWFRVPSLISGALLVPLTFAWVRRVGGVVAGLTAAFLIAFSPICIVESQAVRQYMALLVLIVASLDALERYLTSASARSLAVFVGAMATALLLHFSAMIVLVVVSIYAAARVAHRARERRDVVRPAWAFALLWGEALLVFLWRIPGLVSGGPRGLALSSMPEQFGADAVELGQNLVELNAISFGDGVAPIAVAGVAFGIVAAARARNLAASLLPASALTAAVALSALGLYPLGPSRHSTYLIPFLTLPAAYAVSVLVESRRRPLAVCGLLVAVWVALSILRSAADGMALVGNVQRELNVLPADARTVERVLRGQHERPRVFLTDQQTYWLMRPLLHLGGHAGWRSRVEDGIRLARWENEPVLLLMAWRMTTAPPAAPKKNHLAWMLDQLDRHPEWKRALGDGEVWVVLGGLGANVIETLPESADGARIRGETYGGTDFFAFQLYPVAYRAWVASKSHDAEGTSPAGRHSPLGLEAPAGEGRRPRKTRPRGSHGRRAVPAVGRRAHAPLNRSRSDWLGIPLRRSS